MNPWFWFIFAFLLTVGLAALIAKKLFEIEQEQLAYELATKAFRSVMESMEIVSLRLNRLAPALKITAQSMANFGTVYQQMFSPVFQAWKQNNDPQKKQGL